MDKTVNTMEQVDFLLNLKDEKPYSVSIMDIQGVFLKVLDIFQKRWTGDHKETGLAVNTVVAELVASNSGGALAYFAEQGILNYVKKVQDAE